MNNRDFQETYKMAVEILTPVNIACDEVLKANEYLYDAKTSTVYFLNQMMWHKFIYTHNLFDEYERYIKSSSEKSLYEWLQSFGYKINDIKLAIKSKAFAHVNVLKSKKTLNDIVLQSKLIDGTPFIPGSSIKGVIRTAILYDLLNKNREIKKRYWNEIKSLRSSMKSAQINKYLINGINKDINKKATNLEVALLHKLNLVNKENKPIKQFNAVCSVMRGISVGDSEHINQAVPMEVLQKIDLGLNKDVDAGKEMPVFRECILPKAKFNFQLKIDKTMTKEIGINSIDDLLRMLQNYFDFVNDIFKSAFGKRCEHLFDEINGGNIYLGSNTGFLTKTLVMALADRKEEAVDFIRDLLDMNFNQKDAKYNGEKDNAKHNGKNDTKISPRTLKATKYKGNTILMGVAKIYKDE